MALAVCSRTFAVLALAQKQAMKGSVKDVADGFSLLELLGWDICE